MHQPIVAAEQAIFHQQLARFNLGRLAPTTPSTRWSEELQYDLVWQLAEGKYLEALRQQLKSLMIGHEGGIDHFIAWFVSPAQVEPGQQHQLSDWLAHDATLAQMRWFLMQEAAGEAGIDDCLAYSEVKLPVRAKLECAHSYRDEMGYGNQNAMYGELIDSTVRTPDLQPTLETTGWESLALGNIMLGLAINLPVAEGAMMHLVFGERFLHRYAIDLQPVVARTTAAALC